MSCKSIFLQKFLLKIWNVHSNTITLHHQIKMSSNKKEDIIRATIKLFYEKGLAATPMSAIAKEANVGMGTIYNYFPTKENLIQALFLYLKEKQAQYVLLEIEKHRDSSVKMKLMLVWNRIIDYYVHYTEEAILLEQLTFLPNLDEAIQAQGREYFGEVFKIFAQGQQEEIVKKGSLQQLAYFAKGGLANNIKYFIANSIEITPEIRQLILQCAWDAVRC
ncbi:MAG: TetR/AcrR family transcriptional regulator [Bacteroidetes bacterium]|nr:MAG: TetR/AcrR family transcriptional regulator [Bacteroidota bacterium]